MRDKTKLTDIKTVVGIGTFTALAFAFTMMTSWIKVSFLSFDAKDAIITVAAFIYGPISAVIISLLVSVIEFITVSTTGLYGLIMNIASSVTFSLVASLIYSKKRDINGALIGFFSAVIATTGVMLLLNVFVTPIYLVTVGVPEAVAKGEVIKMLPTLLLPFNFAKALMNSALAMLLYKPTISALQRAHLLKSRDTKLAFNKNSLIILIVGGLSIILSVIIYLVLIL